MNKNDLVTVYISFTNGSGGKRRPVLVLKDGLNELLLYKITSKYANKSERIRQQYYPIQDWKEAGCKKPSYIDIGSLASLDKKYFGKIVFIGALSVRDIRGLNQFIIQYNSRHENNL
jgi:hypothetical protein